jgi:hypothetical protein
MFQSSWDHQAVVYDRSGVTELLIWIHTGATLRLETWTLKKQIEEKLLIFERKITRRFYGPTARPNGLRRRTNEE